MNNIALVTALYKRPELTNFVLSFYNQQKERLKDKINIELICVGSEGQISKEIANSNGFEYYEYPNNSVSQKHNYVVEVCKNKNIDGIVYVGSDDIIEDVFFDEYVNCIQNNIDFLGFSDVYFLTKDHLGYWGGYKENTNRFNEPVGPGKFYSKNLLEKLNWRPWGDEHKNKGLDSLCWNQLNYILDINKVVKKCVEINGHIIDIKTETNISNINDFEFDFEFDINYINNLNIRYGEIKNTLHNLKKREYDITVIIPTYNNIKFIDDTLGSILNSVGDDNVEILVGIDGCLETLEYVKNNKFYKNITFYYFEKNLGPYVVFNSLVKIAKSKNILFFGSDDIMCPNALKDTIEGLKDNDMYRLNYKNFKVLIKESEPKRLAIGVFGIKKDLILSYNGFEPWRCAADSEFINRMEKNNIKSKISKKVDFYRRIHDNGLTSRSDTGFNSKLRNNYHLIIKQKTNFGPLSNLETYPFNFVKTNIGLTDLKIKNKINGFTNFYDLSILIPTYKNSQYLDECFSSIKESIGDYNVEVLVGVDSCVESYELIKNNSYPPNFSFYFFEKNNGPYIVFNSISKIAKSENIMFFNSDDIMDKNMVSDIINGLNKFDCVKPSYVDFNNGQEINIKSKKHIGEGVFGIKKSVFDYMNGFEPWMCAADSDFMGRIYKNKNKIKYTNNINFYHRIHKNGLTSRTDTGMGSPLRAHYVKLSREKKITGPLEIMVTEPFVYINGGSYIPQTSPNNIFIKKTENPINRLFEGRGVEIENQVKEINYDKINDIVGKQELKKAPDKVKTENKNSNLNSTKNLFIVNKIIKSQKNRPNRGDGSIKI